MKGRRRWRAALLLLLLSALLGVLLAACGAAVEEPAETEPSPEEEAAEEEVEEEPAEEVQEEQEVVLTPTAAPTRVAQTQPAPTGVAPTATAPVMATQVRPTTAAAVEQVAEVEWPPRMRLGDSDVVRVSLLPVEEGYVVTTEFPEHRTVTGTLSVDQLPGYDVVAAARLDGVGFDLSPPGTQRQDWQPGRPLHWRWTVSPERAGQQRLSASLILHWRPEPGRSLPSRQVTAFSRALDVRVVSILGMSKEQAVVLGVGSLLLGLVLMAPLLRRARSAHPVLREVTPEASVTLQPHPSVGLDSAEAQLLQALFDKYARATIEAEFQSGYSGARTFLVLPIRHDGRTDAYTIAKLGGRQAILREYENYATYVEHTLPPVTARIQGRPVAVNGRGDRAGGGGERSLAALRYTFVGAPGQQPRSLRQHLLEEGSPALLEKLYRTFGPNWWMQRRPYTFRLAEEYDGKLPAHYVLAPAEGRGTVLDGRTPPAGVNLARGDLVTLRHFERVERKEGKEGPLLSLRGEAEGGRPALRLRWLGDGRPLGATGRVVATRDTMLHEWTAGFARYGLPDPLAPLPQLMAETVSGSRSTIHGDLNLENALVGPGEFVWLIDFARTGEGHALYDFAHLGAEIVAHVLAVRSGTAAEFAELLERGGGSLLQALEGIARRCLFDPENVREYRLSLYVSCLGALKHSNLDDHSRHCLYLTAGRLVRDLV